MRFPLTEVPRWLPRSSTYQVSRSNRIRQCRRDISGWFRTRSASAARPITTFSARSNSERGGSPERMEIGVSKVDCYLIGQRREIQVAFFRTRQTPCRGVGSYRSSGVAEWRKRPAVALSLRYRRLHTACIRIRPQTTLISLRPLCSLLFEFSRPTFLSSRTLGSSLVPPGNGRGRRTTRRRIGEERPVQGIRDRVAEK
jgi:hypothetical protein